MSKIPKSGLRPCKGRDGACNFEEGGNCVVSLTKGGGKRGVKKSNNRCKITDIRGKTELPDYRFMTVEQTAVSV
jgi:hypothetical protein